MRLFDPGVAAHRLGSLGIVALFTACSASHSKNGATAEGGAPAVATADAGPPPDGGLGADGRIVPECQGLSLAGMRYSPGGTTLPNKCAPFDMTTNNPYAVRCIDAIPAFKTPFAGDPYCILPPPPDQGIQVGYHPQGKDYWNQMWAGDMSGYENLAADWAIPPGVEVTQNYHASADNPDAHTYYRTYFRMRTGSHHAIITMNDNSKPIPDGWIALPGAGAEASPAFFGNSNGALLGVLGGQERPDDGSPATLDKPPEDSGYYLSWPASPGIVFNLHYINTQSIASLREGWVNLWWESDARVLESWYMGLPSNEAKTLDIPAGMSADLHYSWTVPDGDAQPIRLISVFGHRHFWTTSFTSWIEPSGGGAPELVYQSFDWSNMPSYRYDSLIKNPQPNSAARLDGAASGMTMLQPGDKLHFNCHIEYTDQRASTNQNAPTPESNGDLRFNNETFKAEMCIQFGNVTGGLGFPSADTSPLPSFVAP
ncbi:MAG TPA: hypothetical protein VKU41_30220 [Polyangiaceae bacterium]|nr:hypothetical protein [Polyangiaceae bacterium]